METYFIYNMSFMMFLGLRFYSYVNMHLIYFLWNFWALFMKDIIYYDLDNYRALRHYLINLQSSTGLGENTVACIPLALPTVIYSRFLGYVKSLSYFKHVLLTLINNRGKINLFLEFSIFPR